MKRIIYIFIALSSHIAVQGQEVWDMDRCMQYAVDHSTSVELQRIEARQARADYSASVASFFPTVSAGVTGQYSWGRGINPETNTYNTLTTFYNYYQLYASLPVFDGFRTLNAFKQARLARKNSVTEIEKARDAKAIEVMQCFIDAVYASVSIRLAEEKLTESRRVLDKTRRMFELGEKSRPDVAQAEAQVAEDDYSLTHQRNEADRTLLALKSAMNFPISDTLRLDTVTDKTYPSFGIDDASSIYESFSKVSPELLSAEFNVKNSRYDYLKQRAELMPSLTLYGGFETSYYKTLSQESEADPFHTQLKNNRGEYVYLTLSIPLFSPSLWKSARRAKTDWESAMVTLQETSRKLHDDIHQAVMDRDGYAKEIVQMERKVSSDSLAHYLDYRKFEEGMLSTFELRSSAQTLLESRITLLQMRLLYVMKDRLVGYYKGNQLTKK